MLQMVYYLLNATVFDYITIKWAVVARMRANKENSDSIVIVPLYSMDACIIITPLIGYFPSTAKSMELFIAACDTPKDEDDLCFLICS